MRTDPFINVVILAGLVGFAVFCVSHAIHVWQRRRAAMNPSSTLPKTAARFRRFGFFCMGAGLLLLLAAVVVRELDAPVGRVSGDNLFTLRAKKDLELKWLVGPEREVDADEVIARFRSPDREAEMAVLKIREQILEEQRKEVLSEPLKLDTELVRQYQDAMADHRQLRASIDQLLPARDRVVRDEQRDRVDKEAQLRQLEAEAARVTRELEQAIQQREQAQRDVDYLEGLVRKNAGSTQELSEKRTQLSVLEAEVSKLQEQTEHLSRQMRELKEDLGKLTTLSNQQASTLSQELDKTRKAFEATDDRKATAAARLQQDLDRACRLREHKLTQIDLEARQCRAQLTGLHDTLNVTAPFPGRVVYRESSPQTAYDKAPIVVLASEEGFVFHVRMPGRVMKSLQAAGPVTLELTENAVEMRFSCRLLTWHPLPHDEDHVLAKMVCVPPDEVVRHLALGEKVQARLLWKPPLYLVSPFYASLAAGVIGVMFWLMGTFGFKLAKGESDQHSKEQEQPSSTTAASTPSAGRELEYGSVGTVISMVGAGFREAIVCREEVDQALLASLEWNLDRHHARAIRLLSAALDDDPTFTEHAVAVLGRLTDQIQQKDESGAMHLRDLRDRLVRVLRVVGPQSLKERLANGFQDQHLSSDN